MHEIEQKAGKALVAAVDAEAVDSCRKETYLSYESFLRAHLHTLDAERAALWQRDYSNSTAYEESVEPMRQRFAEMLGFWQDPADRPPVSMGTEEVLWQDEHALATRFSYEVRPGLHSYAVRMRPKTKGPHPGLVVQHGYMGTPEMACGLVESANAEDYAYRSMGLRAVQRGYCVIA
ncbi:MAG: hypothetical protein ACI906_004538, partial [Candidatus Latescibacterota bacterium]